MGANQKKKKKRRRRDHSYKNTGSLCKGKCLALDTAFGLRYFFSKTRSTIIHKFNLI